MGFADAQGPSHQYQLITMLQFFPLKLCLCLFHFLLVMFDLHMQLSDLFVQVADLAKVLLVGLLLILDLFLQVFFEFSHQTLKAHYLFVGVVAFAVRQELEVILFIQMRSSSAKKKRVESALTQQI